MHRLVHAEATLLSADPHSHEAYESQLSTTWKHDSFVAPLDSRMGELTEGR